MMRLSNKCNYFHAAAMKFKNFSIKYYTLVDDLKEMIRTEKKWSSEDFDTKIQQFKASKYLSKKQRQTRANSMMNISIDDGELSTVGAKDIFDNDDDSEDEAEFEAKRAKDAEDKVIQDIFGGKVC